MNPRIRIIGLGNPLMGDDGAGIAAIRMLEQSELGPGVELLDGGTAGFSLLGMMEGAQRVLLVDAVRMGLAPGEVRHFSPQEALMEADGSPGAHGGGLAEVLALGQAMDMLPPLVIWGIEPLNVDPGEGLSAPVARGLNVLVRRLKAELHGPVTSDQ